MRRPVVASVPADARASHLQTSTNRANAEMLIGIGVQKDGGDDPAHIGRAEIVEAQKQRYVEELDALAIAEQVDV